MVLYSYGGMIYIAGIAFATWIPFYYIDVLEVPPLATGAVSVIHGIGTGFLELYIGRLSDLTRSKWGRRKPWHFFGIIPAALSFYFLWNPLRTQSNSGLVLHLLAFAMLWTLFHHCYATPWTLIFPEMFRVEKQRAECNGFRLTFIYLGTIVGTTLTQIIAKSDFSRTHAMGATLGVLTGVAAVLGGVGYVENPSFHLPHTQINWAAAFRELYQDKCFVLYFFADMLQTCNIVIILGAIPFYFKYVLGIVEPSHVMFGYLSDETQFSILFGTLLGSTLCGLGVWVQIMKKIGPLRTWKVSCLTTQAVLLYFLLIARNFSSGWAGMILYGMLVPGSLLSSTLIYSQVVDEDEIQKGKRREGLYFGVLTMLTKFFTVPVSLVLPVVLASTHYVPGQLQQPDSAIWGIRAVVTIWPMVSCAIVFFCLMQFPLQGARLVEHQQKVKEKHLKILNPTQVVVDGVVEQLTMQPVLSVNQQLHNSHSHSLADSRRSSVATTAPPSGFEDVPASRPNTPPPPVPGSFRTPPAPTAQPPQVQKVATPEMPE
eukprot:TRINITY_DN3835_c0_g1_i1.p1 TRINITY_DN3835_c0_g1~~TRINITY_DN3835_c0_g1_i1.p1  ORF type:complete len:604 (+),score=112.90 TRINITY_DN3835_c0_g1_i1:189-1814(+)